MCGCHRSAPACLCQHQAKRARMNSEVIRLIWHCTHAYSCFFLLNTQTHAYSSGITHLQYPISESGIQGQGWLDPHLYTYEKTNRHKAHQKVSRKSLSVAKAKLSQDYSLSLSFPLFYPSLAGALAFDLEDSEQGTSARLGKDTKQKPSNTQPFIHFFNQLPFSHPSAKIQDWSRGEK